MSEAEISLKTVPNVPIVSTGTYKPSTGEHTFTQDDLASAVAAQDDPAVPTPRLKLGHVDARFDGEPCFGKVDNMRLDEDGHTIYADLVGVPEWLAKIMPTAYPSRSIEAMMNVTLSTGKHHDMVITALSLLGVQLPAVETLDDLPYLFGADMPDDLEVKAGSKISAKIGSEVMPQLSTNIKASIDVETVRRSYYDTLEGARSWWWIRSMNLNPNELIVDDDEGNLYRVPFTIGVDDVVEFSEEIPVKIEYVDADIAEVAASKKTVAVFASRQESRNEKETGEVTVIEKIKAKLGLSKDATDEEILASIEGSEETGDETVTEEVNTETEEVEEETDGEESETEEVEASKDTVTLDRTTLEQLKKDAAQGVAARAEQLAAKRERTVDAAIKAGKIYPARRDHFLKLLEVDAKGTEGVLAKLEPGLVPTKEIGSASEKEDTIAASTDYPADWFPEVKQTQE